MQKKLLALVIAGLAAGYASAEVKVYGLLDVSLNKYEYTDGTEAKSSQKIKDDWELESNVSRIGFKADYAITEELRAIAKMEYEIYTDDGQNSDKDAFKSRNIYAGLQSKYATIIAGKNDTLVKLAQGKIDQFNDSAADMKAVMVGENRQDNIVIISTNEKNKAMNGFQLSASFMPGEDVKLAGDLNGDGDKDDPGELTGGEKRDGLGDGFGFSATYTDKIFYFAAAIDKDVTPEGVASPTDITRLVADVKLTDTFKVGALWQTAEESEKGLGIAKINAPLSYVNSGTAPGVGDGKYENQDAMLVSAAWEFSKDWTVKAQYAKSESDPSSYLTTTDQIDESNNESYDSDLLALGLDYQISSEKNAEAKVYAYIASIETGKEQTASSKPVIGTSFVNQISDSKQEIFAVGYQLKF